MLARFLTVLISALSAFGLWGNATFAQQETGFPTSQVLVIDSERFFEQSEFGLHVRSILEAEQSALLEENSLIEDELEIEEQSLADKRPTLTPEEFSKLSSAFNDKVQKIRHEQDSKSLAINQKQEKYRAIFIEQARPALIEILTQSGASVMLERRTVLLSSNSIDITNLGIEMLNEAIGDGSHLIDNQ